MQGSKPFGWIFGVGIIMVLSLIYSNIQDLRNYEYEETLRSHSCSYENL